MRKTLLSSLLLAVLAALLFAPLALPARAQSISWPSKNGVVADDTGNVNAARVNSAAVAMQNQGADVLTLMMQDISPYSTFDQFSDAALLHYGLGQQNSGVVEPSNNAFVIIVTFNPRSVSILYGQRWQSAMEQSTSNGTQADSIRVNSVTPSLQGSNYTEAFVNGLNAAVRVINNYQNPPTAIPAPTQVPAVVNNTEVDTSGIGQALVIGLVIIVIVGFLIFMIPWLLRTMSANRKQGAERKTILDAIAAQRNEVSQQLTQINLPADPNEQIDYRFLKLALADERPQRLAQITGEYQQIQQLFANTLQAFTNLNERQPNAADDTPQLQQMLTGYQQLNAQVKQVSDFMASMNSEASQVQQQSAAAPQQVDQAKKAEATAAEQYSNLPAVAALQFPPAEQYFAAVNNKLEQAQGQLSANHPLAAFDTASATQPDLDKLTSVASAVNAAYATYAQNQNSLSSFSKQGFSITPGQNLLDQAQNKLRDAAKSLTNNGDDAVASANQAADLAQQALTTMQQLATVRDQNAQRIAAIEQQGKDLANFINQGRQTFDQVDDYAPSSWDDIKGNGSEAQASADRAQQLWAEASALNRMAGASETRLLASIDLPTQSLSGQQDGATQRIAEPSDEEAPAQDFVGAQKRLDEAEREITRARTLVQAIIDRLTNLRESQRTAQNVIAVAQQAIQTGRGFIKQYDPDISPAPDNTLDQADKLVKQAQAEIAKGKPDWIEVVSLARSANDQAQQALSDAQTQEQKMAALRQDLQTAHQQATTSISKSRNFAQAHESDLNNQSLTGLTQGESALRTTDQEVGQQQGLEDTALAAALTAAIATYKAAQQNAEASYTQMYSEFSQMEAQRQALDSAIRSASDAVNRATSYINTNGGTIGATARGMLEKARRMLPNSNYRRDLSVQDMQQLSAQAEAARQQASIALTAAQRDVATWQEAESASQAAQTASTIGGLFSGSGSSSGSSSGGGFSWGSGSSGSSSGHSSGSWGGGGHSSGSWGGGGSSSSSFGGGGHSSGGW